MLNKLDNLNPQTRFIIAVVLALAFFVPYSYFYSPKENATAKPSQNIQTPSQEQTTPQASIQNVSNTQNTQNSTDSQEIIATIKAKNFEYKIDRLGRITQVLLKEEK